MDGGTAMSLFRFVVFLCLTVTVTQSQGTCLGLGFTETIPAVQEWSNYSTTVLKPGDAVLYSSLGFACNGTVHSLTIPSEVRGNIYRYVNQYLSAVVSVWRFNDTGYYRVREFWYTVTATREDRTYRELRESVTLQHTIEIRRREIKVLAKDILGFQLLSTGSVDSGSITVIRHLPLLFKPGPSPSAFIPIVSAKFTASSGPVSDISPKPHPSSSASTGFCDCGTTIATVLSQKCITSTIVADSEMNTARVKGTPPPLALPQTTLQPMGDKSLVIALGGLLALSFLLLLVLTVVVVVLAVRLKRPSSYKTAAEDRVYYNAATSYPSSNAGAISSSTTLLVPSDADSTTTQQSQGRYEEGEKYFYVPNSCLRKDPNAIYGTVDGEGIYATTDNEGIYEMDVNATFWSPAQTTEAIFDQMSKGRYLEIPLSTVKKQRKLGEGQFGEVLKGDWTTPTSTLKVALKSLKSSASDEERLKLLQEAAIMGQFNHPHIVRLYGVVTLSEPITIVMEVLEGGDLRNHVLKVKMRPKSDVRQLQNQLLRFCREIAGAMEYLSKKGFIHRDLAARNILLTVDTKCKIADFGMSHDMDEDYYYKPTGGTVPVKWTAPEAILYRKYTTKSDVWSYGMVMYEIWSLGQKPFEEFSIEEVIQAFNTGYCQPPPPGCPREVYAVMVKCWHPDHHSRVSFTEVVQSLNYEERSLLKVDPRDKTGAPLSLTLGAPLEHGQELYKDLQDKYKK